MLRRICRFAAIDTCNWNDHREAAKFRAYCSSRSLAMQKAGIFLLFIPAAVLLAGLFGMIHNQISYSVSAEYFTRFKFIQFKLLDSHMPERVRAAEVGFFASWWLGIPLGVLCGSAGFVQRSPALMARALIWSLPVLAAFTLMIALAGLAYGWHETETIDVTGYRAWFIPPDLKDLRRFLCAGYMHNSAYLGGLLSIPAAWIFHFVFRICNS
jgi:hypothetical protein